MKRKTYAAFAACTVLSALLLTSCVNDFAPPQTPPQTFGRRTEEHNTPEPTLDPSVTDIPETLSENENTLVISTVDGTDSCWSFDGNVLTFSQLASDTVCAIEGTFNGSINIDAGEDHKFELEMRGLTLYSSSQSPIVITSGNKVTLTAKKDTENFIYDTRKEVGEEETSAAVISSCDLTVGGKGKLTVISENNNGIHSKDDLEVKNLTLSVTCSDNALKGNDSAELSGGNIILISKSGDAIKTTSTDVSSKGNQRGNVTVTGTRLDIYSSADGIDASYDVFINEESVINIYAGRYSPYSSGSSSGSQNVSAMPLPDNAQTVPASFIFGPGGNQGGRPGDHGREPFGPGGRDPFGPGGMGEGNNNKGDGKGIKAGNAVNISGGTILIKSDDDAVHSNGDASSGIGTVSVSGGDITIYSGDDGFHSSGELTVSGGKINVCESYEGLEGLTVNISGGEISVVSDDDGVNATATSGNGIILSGGTLYIYAGGDGIDANSRTRYSGITFSGCDVTVISTSTGNSSIDTEQGYTYTSGSVLSISPSRSMTNETMNCQNFNSVASTKTMSLSSGQKLSVSVDGKSVRSVTMPCSLSALVVYLGSTSASFSAE